MYINLGYLKNQIRLRNPEITEKNDHIGSLLKHHRLKKHLTLEDGAEGICSISYLSKIENSLIKPTEKYILQFEEKYNMSLKSQTSIHSEYMQELIENMFYGVSEYMDDQIFSDSSYPAKLNLFGYFISQKDFLKAKKVYFELNPYIKNLNNLELTFYLYLTSQLLENEGRIKDAFLTLLSASYPIDNLFLQLLIQTYSMVLAFKMHSHVYIATHYETLIDALIENEFYHQVHILKFKYLEYLVPQIHKETLDEWISKSKSLEKHQINYLKAKHYFLEMNYEAAYDLLKDMAFSDIAEARLFLMIVLRLKSKIPNKSVLKKINPYDNVHFNVLIAFFEIKKSTTTQLDDIVSFIQNQILKTHDLSDEVIELTFWYEEGIQYLKRAGFYKDASTLGSLIFRKIKDISYIKNKSQ